MKDAYVNALKNYVNFKDRTSRSGYWYYVLANFIVAFLLGFVCGLLHVGQNVQLAVSSLYSLAVLLPGIAITVRRLHDINKSGWFYFIGFIPLVGTIILLVWLCTASVDENNQYGTQV